MDNPLVWRNAPPSVADLQGRSEEYFWARGGNFNRPIMVRANNGVFSVKAQGVRQYRPELNFTFYVENYPSTIWAHELGQWPGLAHLLWAGPVPRPVTE